MTSDLKAPGVCRYCQCNEAEACILPDGDTCSWLNPERTVCTAPACLVAYFRDRECARLHAQQRNRRRTPAEILALRKQEQAARRQAARRRRAGGKR